ncbi:MAG: nitrite reductase small subunit NirD [Polyangiales bacterium]
MRVTSDDARWRDICATDDVLPGTGVPAMLDHEQIAVVRTADDRFFAISNFDPFSRAFVLARGIVGDRAGVPKLASPMYKQSFALETGECLDDASVRVPVYPLRVISGRVQVALENHPDGATP